MRKKSIHSRFQSVHSFIQEKRERGKEASNLASAVNLQQIDCSIQVNLGEKGGEHKTMPQRLNEKTVGRRRPAVVAAAAAR